MRNPGLILLICIGFIQCKSDKKSVQAPLEPSPQLEAYQKVLLSTLPASISSCPIYKNTQCQSAQLRSCELYDSTSGGWATQVPPMTEQAFMFDRYLDLYHQPEGQVMDFYFMQPVLAGTPESEWSKAEYFRRYAGYGDASGWTGNALWGAAARYAATGTEADYERMVEKLDKMTFLFEVMGIDGLLARSHFAMLPEGAPEPNGNWGKAIASHRIGDGSDGHYCYPIAENLYDNLPSYYYSSVEINGEPYATSPTIQGDASRDMYVRSLPGILLALDLLESGERETRILETLRREIPATLKRMKKGRIYNLTQNESVQEAIATLFAGPSLTLDPEDVDFRKLDEVIFYILEQPHPDHLDKFDFTTPQGPPMEIDPEMDFDAYAPGFELDLLSLFAREQRQGEVPIAWSMHVSVRGADTLFMTQWALVAHFLTGDAAYLEFIDKLRTEIDYVGTMNTLAAFQLPKWCAAHYGPSITYPSLYNLLARINKTKYPEFWTMLSLVALKESRLKENEIREDAFFGILYNRMVDESTDPSGVQYVHSMVEYLKTYGMNSNDKLEPDRNYPRNFVDNPDPNIPLVEIAEGSEEWTLCEEPAQVFGLDIPPPRIDGIPIRSVNPLPLHKRIGGALLWQMDPWMVKRDYGGIGMDEQWPMTGLTTPYWVGRADGVISEGRGMSLGWKNLEQGCSD